MIKQVCRESCSQKDFLRKNQKNWVPFWLETKISVKSNDKASFSGELLSKGYFQKNQKKTDFFREWGHRSRFNQMIKLVCRARFSRKDIFKKNQKKIDFFSDWGQRYRFNQMIKLVYRASFCQKDISKKNQKKLISFLNGDKDIGLL